MSDNDDESSAKYTDSLVAKIYNNTLGWAFGAISSLIVNGLFAGLPTVFSGIVWVLRIIFMILYYVLFKIVPFLIQYIGIPMFILGAILGIMFLGGHMLFVIVFIVGMFFYIRGLLNIKLVSNTPKINIDTALSTKQNNNEFKIK